jgi:hypothetical protein
MPPVRFKPTISAGERPQTYALDRAATGTGQYKIILNKNCSETERRIHWRQFGGGIHSTFVNRTNVITLVEVWSFLRRISFLSFSECNSLRNKPITFSGVVREKGCVLKNKKPVSLVTKLLKPRTFTRNKFVHFKFFWTNWRFNIYRPGVALKYQLDHQIDKPYSDRWKWPDTQYHPFYSSRSSSYLTLHIVPLRFNVFRILFASYIIHWPNA